jgi:hypothetical protein
MKPLIRKKATEQLMPEADFPALDLKVEAEEEVLEEKEMDKTTKDSITEYNFANAVVIDNNRTLVLDQHVINSLWMNLFIFLNSNFICHNRGESKSLIQHQVVGITSSINWFCACKRGGAIKARLRMEDDADKSREWNETTYARLRKASCFDLNAQLLVLKIQCMGRDERDASILAGMLDLAVVSLMQSAWSRIEQELGVDKIKIGKQIVENNAKLEATELTGAKPFANRLDGPPMPFKYPKSQTICTPKSLEGALYAGNGQRRVSKARYSKRKRWVFLASRVIIDGINGRVGEPTTWIPASNSSSETKP